MSKVNLQLALPRDKSFQAYKDWILGMSAAIAGKKVNEVDDLTPDEWKRDWKEFWQAQSRGPVSANG